MTTVQGTSPSTQSRTWAPIQRTHRLCSYPPPSPPRQHHFPSPAASHGRAHSAPTPAGHVQPNPRGEERLLELSRSGWSQVSCCPGTAAGNREAAWLWKEKVLSSAQAPRVLPPQTTRARALGPGRQERLPRDLELSVAGALEIPPNLPAPEMVMI